jgi:hypothetical protein
MFRRLVLTCFTLTAAFALASARPASRALPSASTVEHSASVARAPSAAPVHAAASTASSRLSGDEMRTVRGGGWRNWLKKLIRKIYKYITHNPAYFGESSSVVEQGSVWDSSVSGDVTETYENTSTEEINYASQADYDGGLAESQSASETGYVLTDVSYGGDRAPLNRDMAY